MGGQNHEGTHILSPTPTPKVQSAWALARPPEGGAGLLAWCPVCRVTWLDPITESLLGTDIY